MDECKVSIEMISNRSNPRDELLYTGDCIGSYVPLRSSCIGRHNDRVFPIGYVLLDPAKHGRLGEKIIDGYIKESLRAETPSLQQRIVAPSLLPESATREDPW